MQTIRFPKPLEQTLIGYLVGRQISTSTLTVPACEAVSEARKIL